MGDGDVLYMREEKSDEESTTNDENIWDDTALIEAYDHAVSLAKSEVEIRLNGYPDGQRASSSESSVSAKMKSQERKYSNGPGPSKVWSVGDPCRCIYSADNTLYEADIVKIEENGTAIVRYFGYNNEEEVLISDLLPSRGRNARRLQQAAANPESTPQATDISSPKYKQRRESPSVHRRMDWEPNMHNPWPSTSNGIGMPPPQMMGMPQMMFPPPPPPNMLATPECPGDESEAMSAMLMSWYMSGFHTGYYQGLKQSNTQSGRTPPRRK